tara:strand:+ start:1235 stop:1906 length:672 start_codon:yes stop_codon:yes gene_type:complete
MEAIEKELQDKMIEKPRLAAATPVTIEENITELENAQIVEKKPRSEAQKKAFEKARAKRMENLKKKEQAEASQVKEGGDKKVDFDALATEEVKEQPTKKKRGRPMGTKNKKVMKYQEPPPTPDKPYYPHPVEYPIPQAQQPQYHYQGQPPQHYHAPHHYHPPPQPQAPVNNYYYYGAPPSHSSDASSAHEAVVSSEEEDLTDDYVDHNDAQVKEEATLRYRFV